MTKLIKIHCPYWDDLSFGDKCHELAMLAFMAVLSVTFVVLAGGLATVITLSFFEEPIKAPIVQQSKAEQFASELANELAKKDLGVKILVVRE
ncbi:hypothetical protein EBZ38_16530 [bacterium]|nr:hypothetical protein [bacterium]NDD85868.1 hypothetical protein [bacterium]